MHAVVRNYSGKGAKALSDLIEKNKVEVESLIRSVKGFVSYSLVRTSRGGFSVSVYEDKAGTDESIRVARDWVSKNAGKTGAAAPTIFRGHGHSAIEVTFAAYRTTVSTGVTFASMEVCQTSALTWPESAAARRMAVNFASCRHYPGYSV